MSAFVFYKQMIHMVHKIMISTVISAMFEGQKALFLKKIIIIFIFL